MSSCSRRPVCPEAERIICYENDGTFKFRSAEDAFDYNEWGGPSLADLDGDGTVEILDGNRVYSNMGALKWVGTDGMGGAQYTGPVSFGADIDGDGTPYNGIRVYHDRLEGWARTRRIWNQHACVRVAFYRGNPASGGTLLGDALRACTSPRMRSRPTPPSTPPP